MVTIDALELAADWLDSYEGEVDGESDDRCMQVATWLRAEVQRRYREQLARAYEKAHGVGMARARRAVKRMLSHTRWAAPVVDTGEAL